MTITHEQSDRLTDAAGQSAEPRPIGEPTAHVCTSDAAADTGACARHTLNRRGLLRGAAAAGSAVVAAAGLTACGHILSPNENVADGSQPSNATVTDMTAPPAMASSAPAKQMSGGGSMDASKMPDQNMNANTNANTNTNTTAAKPKPSGTLLGSASQIPVGGGVVFASHQVVVTQPMAGTYKAFSSVCTHAGCQCNNVTSGRITCPCHGAAFSISDGAALQGPTQTPLPTRTVTVSNGEIRLQA